MRSAQAIVLRACQARSAFSQTAACGNGFSFLQTGAFHSTSSGDVPQQQSKVAAQLPSLPALLAGTSTSSSRLRGLILPQQVAGMASSTESQVVSTTTWDQLRSNNNGDKKNSLGAAMYALILTFSFGWMISDFYAYPPRVMAMTAMVFFVFYVRRK